MTLEYQQFLNEDGDVDLQLLPAEGVMVDDYEPGFRRQLALAYIKTYIPCDIRSAKLFEITQGLAQRAKKEGKFLSTCGFVAFWLGYRLGCRDLTWLNRDLPETTTYEYINGLNMSKFDGGGRKAGYVINWDRGASPELCDMLFLSNGPPKTEHVCVWLGERYEGTKVFWNTADGGQIDANNDQCAKLVERELIHERSCLMTVNGPKKIIAVLKLNRLKLTAPAKPDVVE